MRRPQESIYIKNFGGIEEALIPLNEINVFIGPQASGKSVTAKLVYFFKEIGDIIILNNKNHEEINGIIKQNFYKYFPKSTWENLDFFEIKYEVKEGFFRLFKNTDDVTINLDINNLLDKILADYKKDDKYIRLMLTGDQIYVPAGRTFFATIQNNIFTFINNNQRFDPFLIKFGADYEEFKELIYDNSKISYLKRNILNQLEVILKGKHFKDNKQEYIIHKDGRKIELFNASSGQQELTPISFLLQFLSDYQLPGLYPSVYIEEPEAHIYPETQKKLIELLVTVKNIETDKNQFTITTHSPYILTAFNNLIQAGAIEQEIENKEDLYKIVPQYQILKPNTVNAYEFRDGKVESLIDSETGFILAERLDAVSEELAIQFDQLLDLKYAVEK